MDGVIRDLDAAERVLDVVSHKLVVVARQKDDARTFRRSF